MFILVYLDYEILNYFSSRKLATDLRWNREQVW